MQSQLKEFLDHKARENRSGTLTPKEFDLNKNLLSKMGIANKEAQEDVAGAYALLRKEINPAFI